MIDRRDGKISRLLILELGGIGDVILSVPAVLALCRGYHRWGITILTVPRSLTVLERLGESEAKAASCRRGFELLPFPLRSGFPACGEAFSRILSLRKIKYDLLVDLSGIESWSADVRRRLLVGSIGAGKTVGRGSDGRGGFYDLRTAEDLSSTSHEMDRKLEVSALLGLRSPVSAPIFHVRDEEREKVACLLERNRTGMGGILAAMHPGGMGIGKRWPAERFTVCGRWLTDNVGAILAVIGGPGEDALVREVCKNGGDKFVPVTNLSLGEVAALLERSSLFLTNDSGPMHLAAALGVPTVAIFGQTNRHRYLPLLPQSRRELAFADPYSCSRGWKGSEQKECRRKRCESPDCIRAVSVDEVISKMESLCSRIGIAYSTIFGWTLDVRGEGKTPESVEQYAKEDAGFITRRARKLSLDLVREADGPILDIACGKGYLLGNLVRNGGGNRDLWGVDISMSQLKKASSMLRRMDARGGNGKPRLVLGDIGLLPFRTGAFSTSLCINTLLNLDGNGGLRRYFAEISRVTRPGGSVYVELRNPMNPLVVGRFLFGRILRRIPLRAHKLRDVIEAGNKAGLSLSARESVGPVRGFWAYSYVLVFRKGYEDVHKDTIDRDAN